MDKKIEKFLTIILSILLIASILTTVYLIHAPKVGERFTEFYILNENLKAYDYPTNLKYNENATIIIGIRNLEYRPMNYTVLVFLSNKTYDYNDTVYLDQVNNWNGFLSYNYALSKKVHLIHHNETVLIPLNFSINKTGVHKIEFILLDESSELGLKKVYRELHLWTNVSKDENKSLI
ncbi:DUF1616 domain-containing protein [Methanothermococcus thermolithotrophicus]|uniref:DUF1616 domain-containing protein n=1 Tax=Methanothermococcus thermolithotrophicus TaxID=2186 RepID=UPI0003784146|nr:DUF1616 domain-containing protein [Methanothermococcus thermolithotrophicus]